MAAGGSQGAGNSPAGKTSLDELQRAADDLKNRIEEARRKNDMPVNSSLGDPNFDEKAKDGHLDLPEDDND